MQLNLVQSSMLIVAGIYLALPVSTSEYYLLTRIRKMQWYKLNAFSGQVCIVIVTVVLFLYSYWWAVTVVIWYFAIAYLLRERRKRKCDKELCNVLSIALKQLTNILGSGQLLVPALSHIADLSQSSTLGARFYQLVNSLHPNQVSSRVLEPEEKLNRKFDELWRYFHRIIECGLWHGVSMMPLCSAFQKCVEQMVLADEKITASTAGASISAMLLAFLPGFGLIMGMIIGANPLRILFNKNLGGILILLGSLCIILGLIWSQKIINKAVDGA